MTDQEAFDEIMSMSEQELANVSHDVKKWVCCAEGCDRFTSIKDYGILPLFRWRKKWWDLSKQVFYCGKHWQWFRRVPQKLKYKEYHEINILK